MALRARLPLTITAAVAVVVATLSLVGCSSGKQASAAPTPSATQASAAPTPSAKTSPAATGPGSPASAAVGSSGAGAPLADDIALSLSTAGKLQLQVSTVGRNGAPLRTSLRLTVGTSRTRGSGAVVTQGLAAIHRVALPPLSNPGSAYYYDVRVTAGGSSRVYPASGRYKFVSPSSATQPLTVLVWGDNRPGSTSAGAAEPQAFLRIVSSALGGSPLPALALAGGDLVNGPSDTSAATLDKKYRIFAATENRLAHRMPVMAAAGNHEGVGNAARNAAWRRWFTFPTGASPSGLYYSFNDGDIHFVVLDSASGGGRIGYYGRGDGRNSSQANWLVSDLDANQARWTVVMFHQPLFDPKPSDPWATSAERGLLARLFAQEGVDLVLQGHIHNYRRHEEPVTQGGSTYSLTYLTEGGGGADLYEVSLAPRDSDDSKAFSAYGYVVLHSDGAGTLTGKAFRVDPSGGATTVTDSFTADQVPRGSADAGLGR